MMIEVMHDEDEWNALQQHVIAACAPDCLDPEKLCAELIPAAVVSRLGGSASITSTHNAGSVARIGSHLLGVVR